MVSDLEMVSWVPAPGPPMIRMRAPEDTSAPNGSAVTAFTVTEDVTLPRNLITTESSVPRGRVKRIKGRTNRGRVAARNRTPVGRSASGVGVFLRLKNGAGLCYASGGDQGARAKRDFS